MAMNPAWSHANNKGGLYKITCLLLLRADCQVWETSGGDRQRTPAAAAAPNDKGASPLPSGCFCLQHQDMKVKAVPFRTSAARSFFTPLMQTNPQASYTVTIV